MKINMTQEQRDVIFKKIFIWTFWGTLICFIWWFTSKYPLNISLTIGGK